MTTRPQSFERIAEVIRDTRARLRRRAVLVAAGWGLAIAGGVLLAAVLLAAGGLGGAWFRWVAALVVLGGGVGVAGYVAWRMLRPFRRDEDVARHLEHGLPEMRDGLIASVQFGREWGRLSAGSPALVAALADDVAGRLRGRDLDALTPMTPAKRPWLAVAGIALVWAAVGLMAPALVARGFGALGPADVGEGGTKTGPLVGDLTLTLHFPPYTGRERRVVPNSSGDIEAPKGTRVEVRATTLEAARQAAIRFGDDEAEAPMALSQGRDIAGEFTVAKAGTWRFSIVTEGGDERVESFERRIRLEADQPPTVTMELPAEDMELEDLRAVPVVWTARDDFGMTKGAIVVSLAVDPDHPEKVEQPGVTGLRVRGEDEVDLSVIDARPGDRLALFVEVFDNNGVDGPQRGVSVTRYITVRSPDQKHYELAAKLKETIEALLVALADRLDVDFRAPGIALPATMSQLADRTEAATKMLAEVVAGMADDPLTPKEVRLALAGRLGALEQAFAAEKTFVGRSGDLLTTNDDRAIRQISRTNEDVIGQLEQTIVLVEAMVARLALEDVMAMTQELKESREKLKDLITAYKNNPNEQLKGRIMRDIQRLRERMRAIRERMAELRQKLPEEFLNLDGLKNDEAAKGLKSAEDQLSELEKMINEGKVDEALKALEEMDEALAEMDKALDEDLNDLHAESNPEMQQAINELMDQTRDLMKRQEELGQETQKRADAVNEALKKALEEDLKEKLASINERAGKLRQQVEQIDPAGMPPYREEELDNLRQRVDDLNAALRREDLIEAFEMARSALDHLDVLEQASRHEEPIPGTKNNRPVIQQAQQTDRQVVREISELLEQAQQQMQNAGDPQQMQSMQEQQQKLAQEARQLQQRLGQQRQSMPGMGEETERRAGNAAQAMGESGEQLRRNRPGQARPGQQQAVNELQGLMEGLKQSLKPQRADRDGEQQQGRRSSREKVKIPGAEEFQAPAEFRKELLDAMKDKPPEDYQEQVKRYYESLVK